MTDHRLKPLLRPELSELSAYRVPPEPPRVKLDANESPWPLTGEAQEQVGRALARIPMNRYPDGQAIKLRAALANRYGGRAEQYVVGSGSDEIIALLATAMSRPRKGQERPAVLFPTPTFVMYGITGRGHGWAPVPVPLDSDWDLDLEAMREAFERAEPNVAYYASPNNPTGNQFSQNRLEELVEAYPDTLHVIDEAYVAFASRSASDWCIRHPQCALLGTLSKVGFAAIRVGWVRMQEDLASELDKVRQPFNLNAVSQAVAALALTDLAPSLEARTSAIVAERDRLVGALAAHPSLSCYPSQANFVLVRVAGDAADLCQQLLSRGIAVRRFSNDARLAHCIRITVGTPEENQQLLSALERLP